MKKFHVASLLCLAGGAMTWAGTITVVGADPGSIVGVGVLYKGGGKLVTGGAADKNGMFSVFIPNESNTKTQVICEDVNGKTAYISQTYADAAPPPAFEPFGIPVFAAVTGDTLVSLIDVSAFLAAANP